MRCGCGNVGVSSCPLCSRGSSCHLSAQSTPDLPETQLRHSHFQEALPNSPPGSSFLLTTYRCCSQSRSQCLCPISVHPSVCLLSLYPSVLLPSFTLSVHQTCIPLCAHRPSSPPSIPLLSVCLVCLHPFVFYLFIHLSSSPKVCIKHQSFHPSVTFLPVMLTCLFIYPSPPVSTHPSICHLSLCLPLHPFACPSPLVSGETMNNSQPTGKQGLQDQQ